MADIPTLDAAPEDGAAPAKPGGKKKLIIIILAVLVLAGGGAGAYFFFLGHDESKPKEAKVEHAPVGPPLYVALDPPFVVNFEASQLVRFLQITVQLMSRDPETVEMIKANDPVIRNDLLLLFGNQSYDVIATREGKEKLREQALEAVRKIIKSAGGKSERVEAVYFTSFVMQ
jgi:flagellar protein FliL